MNQYRMHGGILRQHHRRYGARGYTLSCALLLALALAIMVTPLAATAAPATSSHSQPQHRTYVVRQGDTLSAIALRFGITQEALMRANNIRNPNVVYIGQVLIIPGAHTPGPHPAPQPGHTTTYIVKRGDTLGDIAKRFNTTIQALLQANNLRNANHIEVGQVLVIPGQGGKDPGYGKDPVYPVHPPVKPAPKPEPVKPAPAHPPVVQPGKEPVYVPVKPAPAHPPVVHPGKEPVYEPVKPVYPPVVRPPHQPVHPPVPVHKPEVARPTGDWVGHYYEGKYFDRLVETRHDPEIRFNWYTGSPLDGIPEDRFSVRWERTEHFQAGWYRFYAIADDGVRVYVDGTLIIDAWHIQPLSEYTADVYLTSGLHDLAVDYFEEADHAQIHVYYEALRGQPPVIKR